MLVLFIACYACLIYCLLCLFYLLPANAMLVLFIAYYACFIFVPANAIFVFFYCRLCLLFYMNAMLGWLWEGGGGGTSAKQ